MRNHASTVRASLSALQSFVQSGENFTETVAATWCEGVAALDALIADRDRYAAALKAADDQLREYAAERSHGATCNSEWLDRCVATARFHTTAALAEDTAA